MAKTLILSPILSIILAFLPQFFFSKNWLCQSLDIMVSYHQVQYQKKTNDRILKKVSDGRIDGQTDRRTKVIS